MKDLHSRFLPSAGITNITKLVADSNCSWVSFGCLLDFLGQMPRKYFNDLRGELFCVLYQLNRVYKQKRIVYERYLNLIAQTVHIFLLNF